MQGITPFLWFEAQAEDAARFYTSLFPNSRISDVQRYGEAGPGTSGTVMTVRFELDGTPFVALNGGPQHRFTEAVSFVVTCETQEEVDRYWAALTEGGAEGACGWCRDRYGLSWQVVPQPMLALIGDPDPERANRAMHAMLQMGKLDLEAIRRAHAGEALESAQT